MMKPIEPAIPRLVRSRPAFVPRPEPSRLGSARFASGSPVRQGWKVEEEMLRAADANRQMEEMLRLEDAIQTFSLHTYGEATGKQILTSLVKLLRTKEEHTRQLWPMHKDKLLHFHQRHEGAEGVSRGRPTLPVNFLRFSLDELAFQFRKDYPKPRLNALSVHPFEKMPVLFERDPYYVKLRERDPEGSVTFPTMATDHMAQAGIIDKSFTAYDIDAMSSVYYVSPVSYLTLKRTIPVA